MGFLKNLFGANADAIAKKAVEAYTNFDPETATAVQIRQFSDVVDQKAQLVAYVQSRVSDIQNELNDATSNKTRFTEAAKLLLSNGKSADEALSKAEDFKNQIVSLTSDLEQANADLTQYKDSHQKAVDKLLQARKNMEAKIEQGRRLDDQISRAKEAQADAKTAAGLDNGVDTTSAINNAFDSANKKKEEQLVALQTTVDALGKSTKVDSDLADALKQVDGKSTSTLTPEERLAALEK